MAATQLQAFVLAALQHSPSKTLGPGGLNPCRVTGLTFALMTIVAALPAMVPVQNAARLSSNFGKG